MRAWLAIATPLVLQSCAEDAPIRKERLPSELERERNTLVVSQLGMLVRPPEPPHAEYPNQCLPGERKACPPLRMPGGRTVQGTMYCSRYDDGIWRFDNEGCGTPLVIAFDDTPVTFTRPPGAFPIGSWERTEWVSPVTPWLAIDRDDSGCIEGQDELFGPPEGGSNGFEKLAQLDDNGDRRIDASDAAYGALVLWADRDQDRRCVPSEVQRIADAGIVSMDLAFATPAKVPLGSHEGERATVRFRDRPATGHVIDVYLRRMDL
ncbi:MAG TPA: hypothetical protein VM925_08575 [Labilithrix sp.]|nr:hypothetical protein [Labilithrix sp.]